jgi:Alpha-glutamyl/putrescinyl thymine pyrophosphorylase clade 3
VRPKDRQLAQELEAGLRSFVSEDFSLPGIRSGANRSAFIEQLLESIRRIKYISVIRNQQLSVARADPTSDIFDPIKAAILRMREGQPDGAFWFVFLSVHFGKHRVDGWRLARDIYGCLGQGEPWDWARASADPRHFRRWLAENQIRLSSDGVHRRFGNHRKYQSLDAWSATGTGAAFESYIEWVRPWRTHDAMIQNASQHTNGNPRAMFEYLYRSMTSVASFGRTARFDYLTMLGKLGLAPIEPGSAFMEGATGPYLGAVLLLSRRASVTPNRPILDDCLIRLGRHLGVGMQVMEDALCNWQKSPSRFKRFRG